jgi:aryl-alcohol dehydrogenase-like predicted oxidoreductase
MSLRRLGVDALDLFQLHRVDPDTPFEDQIGELKNLQDEGKVRHVGLSEVSVEQVVAAQKIVPIVSVQNLYNIANRSSEALLDWSTENGVGFIPWFPLATGKLSGEGSPLSELAKKHGVSPAQLALAWLLKRSPVMLPIPGTSSVSHLEDNLAGASIELTDDEFEALSNAARR